MSEEQKKKLSRLPEFYKKLGAFNANLVARDLTSLNRYNVTKTVISQAIERKDISSLRGFSQYFFHASGEYRRLVEYFAKMLTFDFIVVPVAGETSSKAAGAKNDKAMKLVMDYLNNSYVQDTGRKIALGVIKDGAFYGYERELEGLFVLQQLPAAYCRTQYLINGLYSLEFDFTFFDQFKDPLLLKDALAKFPEEFAKLHKIYLSDSKAFRWQILDPTFARVHMLSDEVPFLSSIFVDLIELADYKALNKQRTMQDVEEVVIQKIPTDDEGEINMEMDEILTLHENTRMMLSGSTRKVLTTPAEIETLSFKSGVSSTQDDIEKANQMLYTSAGTPMILFSSGSNGGSVGLDRSLQVDEALMFELLDQFERWYENRFKALVSSKNVSFKIVFPQLSVFNKEKMVEQYQSAATYGLPTKLLWMAALGIDQARMTSLLDYENEVLNLPDRMVPATNSHTLSPDEGGNEGGRPESKEPLSKEGQVTKDKQKNDNRAKKE